MRADTFKLISMLDPAIDHAAMTRDDMVAYIRSRDISKLKLLPAVVPMVFSVRRIPNDNWLWVQEGATEGARHWRAFRCGVVSVQNLAQIDGVMLSSFEPALTASKVMTEEAMERFYPSYLDEIGSVIYEHSFLAPWTEPSYLLPRSLLEPLDDLRARRAAASQSSPAKSSNGASSSAAEVPSQIPGETAPQSQTTDVASGSPGAATAAGIGQ